MASVDGVDRVSVSGFGFRVSVKDIPMFFLVALKKNMSVFSQKDVEVFLKLPWPHRIHGTGIFTYIYHKN